MTTTARTHRIHVKIARELWDDSARFWLHNVQQLDTQTINDVLAIMAWPDNLKHMRWAAAHGRSQVFASAIMTAGVTLADLKMREVAR